jgi:Autotransporter beta-domain
MKLLKASFFLAAAATATSTADAYPLTPFDSPITITNGSPQHLMLEFDPSNGFRHRTDGLTDVLNFSSSWTYTMHAHVEISLAQITASGNGVNMSSNTMAAGASVDNTTNLGRYRSFNPADGLSHAYIGISYEVSTGNYNYGWVKFSNVGLTFTLEDAYMNSVVNGSTIVGVSFSGITDFATWMSSIDGQHRVYNAGSTLAGMPLEGAHHRPMLSFDRMGQDHQAWATGDFGSSSRTRDVHVTTGEAGVNWNVGKTGLFGFAAGHGEQNADLAFNGSSSTKGDYGLVEYDYRPEGTQWIVSLLGMVGSWESKINRGYTSGASTDFSFGVADIISRSARLRVDAPTLVTYGGFGFAPYASYSVTQTIVGAYAETGGAFPASFNEQSHNSQEGRLGITATKDVSAATKLLLTVEAIHRFDGVGPGLTGQDVTDGFAFSLPGTAPRPDCVRFGFDIDHKLNENTLLNVSAHVATVGEAHDVSAAISIRRAF